MQQDGAARAPAPTARARRAAAVAAMRVEPVDATRRRVAQAGAAEQGVAVQVTLDVTWRHCMATMRPAGQVAHQLLAAQVQAVRMVGQVPEARLAPMG